MLCKEPLASELVTDVKRACWMKALPFAVLQTECPLNTNNHQQQIHSFTPGEFILEPASITTC